MKKLILIFLIIWGAGVAKAQIYKVYLDKNGSNIDPKHAESYVLISPTADSLWLMKEYGMNDTIRSMGTFKDKSLATPHGKFVYYTKLDYKGMKFAAGNKPLIDTFNFVATVGYYENGLRTGRWVDFGPNGQKVHIKTYSNDKLNGPFVGFHEDRPVILVSGSYIDDMRQGEWFQFDIHGDTVATDIYQDDKVIKRTYVPRTIGFPQITTGFITYLSKNIPYNVKAKTKGNLTIACDITAEGKLIHAVIEQHASIEADKYVMSLIPDSPAWSPAYRLITNEDIPFKVLFTIIFDGSDVIKIHED